MLNVHIHEVLNNFVPSLSAPIEEGGGGEITR